MVARRRIDRRRLSGAHILAARQELTRAEILMRDDDDESWITTFLFERLEMQPLFISSGSIAAKQMSAKPFLGFNTTL
jgi:hypothetical protein